MEEIEQLKLENEKLKKINSVKSDLISISTHQLYTSLSAIKWTLKMFIDKDLGEITKEQENFIKRAIDSNEKMIKLVSKLLIINHTDNTSIILTCKNFNIINLIDDSLVEFYSEIKKKSLTVTFDKPETMIPDLKCDEEMIRVILQNIIENAIKYSNNNSKILISVKFNSVNNNIEITVNDKGIGINEEDKEKIFNKFFRAKNAQNQDINGSGLGLFTTKKIIELHNGKIWFDSDKENGTTFYIDIPIS